jgi:hypothetical protein
MDEKTIQEIHTMLTSPVWWFVTIFVALLVNIAANFIYDAVKPYVGSAPGERLIWALVLMHGLFVFLSCLYFNPTGYHAKAILPILAVLLPLAIFWECYELKGYGFLVVFTFTFVFGLVLFFEMRTIPKPEIDTTWLARQYFYAAMTASFANAMWSFILRWREMLSRRRKKRPRDEIRALPRYAVPQEKLERPALKPS